MVIIGSPSVEKFLKKHEDLRQEVHELIRDLEAADLRRTDDVIRRYPSSKVLDGKIVVFKVRGNKYRLTTKFAYGTGIVRLIALDTHAEYDRRSLR